MNDEIQNEKLEKLKEKSLEDFCRIGKIRCPYLQDEVHFNEIGFNHLVKKAWNKKRSDEEQLMRLRLLPYAYKLLRRSHTLQEFDERKLFVRQKTNRRWEKHLKTVYYYVFVGIIDKVRIKVVVKEVEGSEKMFYSLYPAWKMEKDFSGKPVRGLSEEQIEMIEDDEPGNVE